MRYTYKKYPLECLRMPGQDEWLSVEEIAQTLKMDVETVRNWIRRKQLKAYKFGRDYRIRREDFDIFVKNRATTSQDEQ
jgi:excisionase family DNA binding protein